nr:hypothetical protein WS54_04395 [Burkholderia sp. NRF60-BP8]
MTDPEPVKFVIDRLKSICQINKKFVRDSNLWRRVDLVVCIIDRWELMVDFEEIAYTCQCFSGVFAKILKVEDSEFVIR